MEKVSGYEKIYCDLVNDLKSCDLKTAAGALDLNFIPPCSVEISLLGKTYQVKNNGIRFNDGKKIDPFHGSILAGYLLKRGSGVPSGNFVTMDSITRMVPARISFVNDTLESPLAKFAELKPHLFHKTIVKLGGNFGGDVGLGGKSWIIYLLSKIPVQLIFYRGDEDFPSEVRLLFDSAATNFLEFEFLAVLASIFVDEILAVDKKI